MKKIVIISLAILLLALLPINKINVRANELFGDGIMVTIGDTHGVIIAWGVYAIYGSADDCRIVPLYSKVGDAVTASCFMRYNNKGNKFSGWIDFRGHPRPFCGTKSGDFPDKCYGD